MMFVHLINPAIWLEEENNPYSLVFNPILIIIMKIYLKILIFCILFIVSCTLPDNSEIIKQVKIENVFLSDVVDNDVDGFASSLKLNFSLKIIGGNSTVIIKLFSKKSEDNDTSTYSLYYDSGPAEISVNSSNEQVIQIGNPNAELIRSKYDFLVQVLPVNAPDFIVAEISAKTDSILAGLTFEPSVLEAKLMISTAYWDLLIDYDGDGYARNASLITDVNVDTGSAQVFLAIFYRLSESPAYQLYTLSEDFVVNESSSFDLYEAIVLNLPFGIYDFKIDVHFSGSEKVEISYDMSDNPALSNVRFELPSEDPWQTAYIFYHDGSFEEGSSHSSGNILESNYAVRFDKPSDAISCRIKQIRIFIFDDPSFIKLRAWSDGGDFPGSSIYTPADFKSTIVGWNIFEVNINVSENEYFYVGYRQLFFNMPSIGIDTNAPHALRSYKFNSATANWELLNDGNLGIELLIEYSTFADKTDKLIIRK